MHTFDQKNQIVSRKHTVQYCGMHQYCFVSDDLYSLAQRSLTFSHGDILVMWLCMRHHRDN